MVILKNLKGQITAVEKLHSFFETIIAPALGLNDIYLIFVQFNASHKFSTITFGWVKVSIFLSDPKYTNEKCSLSNL